MTSIPPRPAAGLAVLPFVAIAAAFAAAAAWHLGGPARRAADVRARIAAPDTGTPVTAADFVSLSRSACRGGCPAYALLLHGDGRLQFSDGHHVCTPRPVADLVDAAAARHLLAAVADAGFARWPEPGRRAEPGVSVVSMELHVGGNIRRTSFTEGQEDDRPEYAAVARAVDETAGVARWLPGPDGRCPGR